MTMIHGSGQIFSKEDVNGRITLLMAKKVAELLIAGIIPIALDEFLKILNKRFEVGKVQPGPDYTFNGCEISRDSDASVKLSMDTYL